MNKKLRKILGFTFLLIGIMAILLMAAFFSAYPSPPEFPTLTTPTPQLPYETANEFSGLWILTDGLEPQRVYFSPSDNPGQLIGDGEDWGYKIVMTIDMSGDYFGAIVGRDGEMWQGSFWINSKDLLVGRFGGNEIRLVRYK